MPLDAEHFYGDPESPRPPTARVAYGPQAATIAGWPRPGSDEPFEKETLYTKVGDQICGVGYYKK